MPVPLLSALSVLVLLASAAPLSAQETAEASPALEPTPSEPPPPSEQARALFLANCATCHGETGDGQGTTQLDRPARSFMDGGFSFGNTPEALFRTISVGIPGTPMPGFEASLSEEQRNELARYVVTLGPPVEETEVEDMLLAVHDRPVIVRGLLPPLADGLPSHPRGLLIGDPSGITFEYQVDDVRLLALRQGEFVERTDWNGRGGTPLKPLGKVVHMMEEGKPEATFSLAAGALPLEARLSGTRVDGGRAVVDYHLVRLGHEVAHVAETVRVWTTPAGTGFVRRFDVLGGARRVHLALEDRTQSAEVTYIQTRMGDPAVQTDPVPTEQGFARFGLALTAERWSRRDGKLIVDVEPGTRTRIELLTMPALVPDVDFEASWMELR